jgi:hypothetical protein
MPTFDPDQLTEAANEHLNESAQRDPRDFRCGLFAWGDAPPACGGGIGCFQWFATVEEALTFVTDSSPALYCTFDEEDEWLLMRQRLRAIADQWQDRPVDALAAFNAELKGLLQIDWIGRYQDLCEGSHPFCTHVREAFAETEGKTDAGVEAGHEDWLAFLQQYGF